ncbi:MAG: ATP-binding cassette domain-containing protein [Lachnospiraceae bacterium]
MAEIILQTKDLGYRYGSGKPALEHVNVRIEAGEKIAIVGSNGAGKSTFFLNLNGVLTPEAGEISYRGTVIHKKNLKNLRKNIGIVFQDPDNQMIASTVWAEVAFGPMNLLLKREEVQERVEEALDYMNLAEYASRPPHYLSGGEKKRVSIADIIAMRSELIIFDEPTASLDPLNAQMLEGVLKKLEEEGKTLLISTHDMEFAYRWADRLLVFHNGTIVADGTPREVFLQEEILQQTNLKKPILMQVYEIMKAHGITGSMEGEYPRTPEELEENWK